MASTIVTKNSSTASAVPVSGDLTQGELAVNVTDKRLFTKNSGGTVVEVGTNPSSLTVAAADATFYGVKVGRGAGADSGSTVVGSGALAGSNTGGNNTAIGRLALAGNTSGSQNNALGYAALTNNTTGADNTAIGYIALYSNTTGNNNVAVGRQALYSNTTASNNTAVGYQAGYTNSTGGQNTFVGRKAGYTATGGYNTAIGDSTGLSLTTGTANTFVGAGASNSAGADITTGSKNTIIGAYGGNSGGLDIRTSSNNVVLSDGDGNIAGRWVNGGGWYQLNNSASWSTTSDARIKENVETIVNGLDIVMALRPVEFDYKLSKQHMAGFLAQEYEQVLPDQIIEDFNIGDELKQLTNGEAVKGIQQNLVPYLVNAIQILKAEFDAYKASHP